VGLPSNLAAAGVWPALPLTGYIVCARTTHWSGVDAAAPLTAGALMSVIGLAVWSVPLLGSVAVGLYWPVFFGVAGWAFTFVGCTIAWRRRSAHSRTARVSTAWEHLLRGGLLLAAIFYLAFPTESIYGGRDEGVYADHAVYMVHHGKLDVPYPWPADANAIFADVWTGMPGFYNTPGTMTVQFGHLFPVWLAQAYATFGQYGLFRLNGVFAVLALAVTYDVFQLAVGTPIAVVATLFLALNPSEMWMARITLSEILTQLFIWSGLCFLLRALKEDNSTQARWAGVCLGMSALVRFDGLLVLPMLLLAHVAYRFVAAPTAPSRSTWNGLYATAIPLFALSTAYYFVFSRPYLMERMYVHTLAGAAVGAAVLLLASRPAVIERVRQLLAHRAALAAAGVGLFALAAYAYWIRPLTARPPLLVYQWPGFYIDFNKGNYRSDSLADLAQYLSPLVVWAAIAGWYASLWQIVRGQRGAYLSVPLVLAGGFSVAYLYDHFNTPDHLWWIRRFIPVVVPGFVLYAAFAAQSLLERLPSRWSRAAAVLLVTFLVAFTVHADRLIATFAEDQGLFNQLERLAQRLPAGVPIITYAHKSWVTPLYVAFDRQVIPLDLASADGQQAWRTWSARCAAAHQPAYLLSQIDPKAMAASPDDVTLSRSITEPSINRLPRSYLTIRATLRLAAVDEPDRIVLPPPAHQHADR
jgi:hypothetical protein